MFVLERVLVHSHGADSPLARRIGSDTKGKVSTCVYALAFAVAWASPQGAAALYVLLALV